MDAVLSVAEGHLEAEDYFLDLDAGAGVEDFDFKLDGAFESEAQQRPPEVETIDSVNQNADFEIGYEEEEAHEGPSEIGHVQDFEETGEDALEETGEDALEDTGMDYQDEIGYEDEDPSAGNAVVDQGTGGTGTPSMEKSQGISEKQEQHQDKVGNGTAPMDTTLDPQGDRSLDCDESNQEQPPQDGFGDYGEENMLGLNDAADLDVETTDESAQQSHVSNGRTPASGLDDFDESGGVSNTPSTVSEITVHYNQGQYALIGAPNDDPDSFFFSDEKQLDGPLSQFLASIREVISDELTLEDEVTIRIDALNLEFGEKSSQIFLNRSFREVITCYSILASNSSRPYDPHNLDLELLVRRDCESRFLELLEEAGIVGELSHLPDNPDYFQGEDDSASAQDEGEDEGDDEGENEGEDHQFEVQSAGDDSADYNANDDVDVDDQDGTAQAATRQDGQVKARDSFESLTQHHDNGPNSHFATLQGTEALYQADQEGMDDFIITDNLEDGDYPGGKLDITGAFSGQLEDEAAFDQGKDTTTAGFDLGTGERHVQSDEGQQWGEADEQTGLDSDEQLIVGDTEGTALPESISDGNNPPLLSPQNNPPLGNILSPSLPGRQDGDSLIGYSDGDDVPPIHQSGGKRKLGPSRQEQSPKRRRLEPALSAAETWLVEGSRDGATRSRTLKPDSSAAMQAHPTMISGIADVASASEENDIVIDLDWDDNDESYSISEPPRFTRPGVDECAGGRHVAVSD